MLILAIIILVIVAIIACCTIWGIRSLGREQFLTKRDKAHTIYNWFTSTSSPTYTKYKKAIEDSNIVEYEEAFTLLQNNGLTVNSIEQVI